jgi:hypothetical protein
MLVVIVACPEGPAGEPGEAGTPAGLSPIAVGSIDPVTVQAGATPEKVDVAEAFIEPESQILTYTVTSSAVAIATASIVEVSMVSITGVAAGTATLTVTATDTTGLNVTQAIVVTVTAATAVPPTLATTCGTPAMLAVAGKCAVTIKATEKLVSGNPAIVTVAIETGSTTRWTITAVTKGKTTVRVVSIPDGKAGRSFDVTVTNQAPQRKKKDGVAIEAPLISMEVHDAATTGFTYDKANRSRRLYRVEIPGTFTAFFEDKDGETMTFTAESTTTSAVVTKTVDAGFLVDVVDKGATEHRFQFTVYAEDPSKEKSTALVVTVNAKLPRPYIYEIEQFESGHLRLEKLSTIGFRAGVTHYLKFLAADTTTLGGNDEVPLRLVEKASTAKASVLTKALCGPDNTPAITDDSFEGFEPEMDYDVHTDGSPTDALVNDAANGCERYIKISATGPVSPGSFYIPEQEASAPGATPVRLAHPGTTPRADIVDNPFDAGDNDSPILAFTLKGAGLGVPQSGVATIMIDYYIVLDPDGTGDVETVQRYKAASQTLTLNIERVQK